MHVCPACVLTAHRSQKSAEWLLSHRVGARNSPQEEQVSTPACTIFPTPKHKFLLLCLFRW